MSHVDTEIASQPACWRRALDTHGARLQALPRDGERVAVIGCGTSLYIAQTYAALRESAGRGETDAFAASEFPAARRYDRVLAISRSGTTTEVLTALKQAAGTPTVAVTGDLGTPVKDAADTVVDLSFADERSVVQTRFATTALVLLRAGLGLVPPDLLRQAEYTLGTRLPEEFLGARQFTFLGSGWAVGVAHEAALKLRGTAGAWTESYPAMEYRHGPISVTGPGSVVWFFGEPPAGLLDQVRATGAYATVSPGDPLADLIRAQRLAVALAGRRGLDPDQPRHLTRSIVLADHLVES
ncbi:SIS domain-containing protein [Streptomyces sp. HNM0663]|uniref:Glutamine--fructose-6-phosphate aminotransferase [isomerizing] n=1 Tax=Streptomyces chengmaiensis TaxID=3040919 RepID=A0ABT6HX60_9ACTN|nr:SIS domain-containing protein [Streptomyces chengmaiensis]MDH2393283.1 SIS domain-containing protein [Streptomyces chengmaiensis]